MEVLGSKDASELDRSDIRRMQSQLLAKGMTASSIQVHTAGVRAFSKFLRLLGRTRHDPCLLLSHRKLPSRVPRVLTVKEIERLVAACKTPLEKAVVEVLYATGVRISELVALRIEDITWSKPGVIRVNRGKGDKDYVVLFGRKAAAAIKKYLNGRTTGFLFEAPARIGYVASDHGSWRGYFYVDGVQQCVTIGRIADMPWNEAQQKLRVILAKTPGFKSHPARPYNARSIRLLLKRVAFRARVRGVHPHAFRRALASHMLENNGDLRAIQDLLGHQQITSTMYYTHLAGSSLKAIHNRFHPHGDEKTKRTKTRRSHHGSA
jgi:integrase/recombinase XerD